MADLLLFIKLLPTFIKWMKVVRKKVKEGLHEHELLKALETSAEAWNCEDVKETESRINDLWNGSLRDKTSKR